VEKLREKAKVSYDEAKAALDAANGDLLEALIILERQGKVNAPPSGGYYSSGKDNSSSYAGQSAQDTANGADRGETFTDLMKRFGRFCLRVFRKGNANLFEVLKGNESKASVPITVLVLLLVFAFWVTLPLMIIGLFFGLRYRFIGPDIGSNATANQTMDGAAKAAEDIKKSFNSGSGNNGNNGGSGGNNGTGSQE